MSLFRAAFTVGGLTAISRVLGFIRDILMARILGAGWIADCFVLAFKLPNFFRRLFAEGAFSAAFVPMFSRILDGDQDATPEERRRQALFFAEEAFSVLLVTVLLFVSLCQIFMPWVMLVLGMGFADDPVKFDLAVWLSRLTFPYLLFISLVSLLGGILNAFHRFAAVAFSPVLLNITLIGAMLLYSHADQAAAQALAIGVTLAGLLQFVWLLIACRRQGMSLRLRRPRMTPQVKRLLLTMMPVALGAGAYQFNVLVDTFLASFLRDGSIAFLYYADRINQLPLGIIGIAVGTALLPMLSRQVAAGDEASAVATQNRGIEMVLVLTLPAAAALVAMPETLIGVLFQGRSFNADMTQSTAAALTAFAIGLPAYVFAKVLTPGYYARGDTVTPVRFALISLAVNIVLNLILMFPLEHVGLALATAIAAWVNAAQLFFGLKKRGYFVADRRLVQRVPRVIAATATMVAIILIGEWALSDALAISSWTKYPALAGLVIGGMLSYGLAAYAFGAVTRADLAMFKRTRA